MLEAGRIRARIEGDTADFDKKMADAQRTFQVTAQKLDASAQKLADNLKKTYSERVVAANAAATKEIDAARRSMQERLRLTTNSAEIAAVRQQFGRRADAARVGARQEIQAAQQQYMAASQGMRPVISSVDQMTTTTTLATSQLSKLRTATVAVANAAAGANPIFAQTSAVIGAMVGTGGLIALAVGAITALGFAYNRLTKDARELKEEQDKLNDQLERGGRERAGLVAGAENQAAARAMSRMAEITARINELRTTPQFRMEISGTEPMMVAVSQKEIMAEITKLSKEYSVEALKALEVDGKRADEGKKVADEATRAAEAFDRLIESGRELDREMGEVLRKLSEIADEAALAALQRFRLGDLSGSGGLITRPSVTGGMPRTVAPLGTVVTSGGGTVDMAMHRWVTSVTKAADTTEDFTDSMSRSLRGMIDPRNILSGLATGGLSALIGGMTDAVSSFINAGKAADEMAKALRMAREAAAKTVTEWLGALNARLGSPEQMEAFEAGERVRDKFNEFSKALGLNFPMPQLPSLDAVIKWIEDMLKAPAQLRKEDRETLLKILEGAKLEKKLMEMGDAVTKATESMTNVPQGFKIAQRRFMATMPAMPSLKLPVVPPLGSPSVGGSTQPGLVGTATTIHIDTIEMNGVNDPQEFLNRLETEIIRRKARGGTGIALEYLL